MSQYLLLGVAGAALIAIGVILWLRQKKPKTSVSYPFQLLERDYYRVYMECGNCGYVCGTYVKKGVSLEDVNCFHCGIKGRCKPAHLKDYKGVDIVVPETPKVEVEDGSPHVIKTKSKMF